MVDRLVRKHHEWKHAVVSKDAAEEPGRQLWERARALVMSPHGILDDHFQRYVYPIARVVKDVVTVEQPDDGEAAGENTAPFEVIGIIKGSNTYLRRERETERLDSVILQVPNTFEQCVLSPNGAQILTGIRYENRYTLFEPIRHRASLEELAEYRNGFDQIAAKYPLPATSPAQAPV